MLEIILLLLGGFLIGTLGTLIGAGGGFILVPILLITHPELTPEIITAISMAVVTCNAISGTIAYVHSKKVDYSSGIIFALATIPGSILGVYTVEYIPVVIFNIIFGILLLILGSYLFIKGGKPKPKPSAVLEDSGLTHRNITDANGEKYSFSYDRKKGILLSIIVGYISPLLGIGGGIIHVPAMVEWLHFPVHIATATSHFILAIMATVSTIVHITKGHYENPAVLKMVIFLAAGVIAGAQLGAYLSHKVKGGIIIKSLGLALTLVGIRILISVL